MNFLRRSFQFLNPLLISSSGASSEKFTPLVLGKELKFLFFRRGLSQLTQEHELRTDLGANCVQMRGLPFEATTSDIINFFKPLNVEPVEVMIQTNRWGQPSGFATAKFKSYDEAVVALRNHRNYMGRRYVELSLDWRTKDLSQRPLASIPDISSRGHKVILKGLPYEATAEDIIKFFAPLNIKPVSVEMKYGHQNLPSGVCHCFFESQEDAVAALKNHKAYIGKRWVEVFLASQ